MKNKLNVIKKQKQNILQSKKKIYKKKLKNCQKKNMKHGESINDDKNICLVITIINLRKQFKR